MGRLYELISLILVGVIVFLFREKYKSIMETKRLFQVVSVVLSVCILFLSIYMFVNSTLHDFDLKTILSAAFLLFVSYFIVKDVAGNK